jgi:hypothetical protein
MRRARAWFAAALAQSDELQALEQLAAEPRTETALFAFADDNGDYLFPSTIRCVCPVVPKSRIQK